MRGVAFLTTDLDPVYVTDDHLAVAPLRQRGIEVDFVRWGEGGEDWARYDLVVVRSTWDYQHRLDEFLRTLDTIAAETRLENPLDLQRWNVRKTYLRQLDAAGVAVVPTVWRERLRPGDLEPLFDECGAGELVLKPVVGSSGEYAYRVRANPLRHAHVEVLVGGEARHGRAVEAELLDVFRDRPLMVQPFLSDVLGRGESSVVWIDGEPSHALRKTPPPGEFRSQEEHGGRVEAIPCEGELARAAERVAEVVAARSSSTPLYGRIDFLPGPDGWLVGELELVEPSLYLRVDAGAPARFADAIARRLA